MRHRTFFAGSSAISKQYRGRRASRAARIFGSVIALFLGLSGAGASVSLAGTPSPLASVSTSERDLPPLPAVPKLEPPPPSPAEIEDLQSRLERLQSDKPDERREALRDVLDVQSKYLAAILERLEKLAARADRERMKRALAQVRQKSGRDASGSSASEASQTSDTRADLLVQLIEQGRPKDDGWRDLVQLVALSRMLTQIGNVSAARGLIEIYVRFGEFMRVDVQNRLGDLRDGAVAALIEARRHRAEKVARWAERQLDRLGKAAPSEAIRTDNFEVLADVLRAYGRTRDPDAARIVVSYASSERFQLREAARQAIVMLGEVGLWQLRDAYENVVGRRPRRDWSWDRTARELFFEYDRLHAKKVFDLMDEGLKAASERRFEDMAKAYDTLLARAPQFDKAHTLAPSYLAYAEHVANDQPDLAQAALVRVERLTTDAALRNRARSFRDTLVAQQQVRSGLLDTYVLRGAAERDPENRRAKELLSSGDRAAIEEKTIRVRYLTSGAVACIAVTAILFVLLRRRGEPPTRDGQKDDPESHDGPRDESSTVENDRLRDESTTNSANERDAAQPRRWGRRRKSSRLLSAQGSAPSNRGSAKPAVDSPDAPEPAEDPEAAPPKRRDPFEDF